MKNYDYKSKMNNNRKRLAKRVGSIALVTTLAMSTPVATNVISETGFKNVLSTSVVEAATENFIGFNNPRVESFYSDEYEETRHVIYAGADAGDQITLDDKEAAKYVVQLPENLWNQLDADDLEKHLKGNGEDPNKYGKFVMSANVYKKGETKPVDDLHTSGDYEFLDYVSVNKETRSVEYDLQGFMVDHDLDLEKGIQNYDFNVPLVVKDTDALYKDTYNLKLAGVDGNGVDLANVSGAFDLSYKITEGEVAPEPEPDPEVDKTELESELDAIKAENLSEDDYTDASWTALQEALSAAEAVVADEDATQDEIDDALAALTDAREGLEEAEEPETPAPEVDKTDLESELAAIKAENLSEDDYTDASWTAFQEALSAAEAALADEDATQDETDDALAALTDARSGLETVDEPIPEPEVDKTDLESELTAIKAEGLSEDDYTDASWTTFQEALTAAEAVLADEDATQDETDDALVALTDARSDLETVDEPTPEPEVDKTDLESELAAIKAEDLSENDYTETSWTTFQEALSAAEAVLTDEDATQDEIDDALVALTAARDSLKEENEESPNLDLEPSLDKSDLETMLAEIAAANLSETDFTDTSWKAFQEALSVAEAILADKDAIQDEIDNALATLIMAYEGLEKVKELIPENSDEDEVIVDVDSDDDNTLPDTATSTFNWLIGGFIAMLAGVAGLFTRRGRKSTNK